MQAPDPEKSTESELQKPVQEDVEEPQLPQDTNCEEDAMCKATEEAIAKAMDRALEQIKADMEAAIEAGEPASFLDNYSLPSPA